MALKVTIEEVDIKGAIETYVREMIPGLSEDTVVEIDISATRGPSGMTANITLLSASDQERLEAEAAAKAKPARVAKAAPSKAGKPLNIAAKVEEAKAAKPVAVKTEPAADAPDKAPKPEEVVPAPVEVIEEVVEEQAEALADAPIEGSEEALAAEAAATEPAEVQEVEEAPAETAPKRPSLFASVTKPVNN